MVIGEGSSIIGGFIASNNKVYQKILNKGDTMVLPQGLYHFFVNQGKTPAVMFVAFSSESPTVQLLDTALFQNDLATDLILSGSYAEHVQDFCSANYAAPQGPAGCACKDPAKVSVDDFIYWGLGVAANFTANIFKFGCTAAFTFNFSALNVSVRCAEIEVGGVVPLSVGYTYIIWIVGIMLYILKLYKIFCN